MCTQVGLSEVQFRCKVDFFGLRLFQYLFTAIYDWFKGLALTPWKAEIIKPCSSQTLPHQCLMSRVLKRRSGSCRVPCGEQC